MDGWTFIDEMRTLTTRVALKVDLGSVTVYGNTIVNSSKEFLIYG